MKKKAMLMISLVLVLSLLLTLPAAAAETTQPATAAAAPQPVSATQYEQMVRDSLAAMATAYQQRDLRAFMSLVSADFVGDDFLMYRAVRKDFRFLDNIVLYLYVDGFAVNSKGRAQVTVRYNRNVIANRPNTTGAYTFKDSGLTQMTFVIEDGQAKLYDVKFPLIFGLSEGMQVASGVVRSAESSSVMVIDRQGNVNVLPFNDAVNQANGVSAMRGVVHLTAPASVGNADTWSLADNRRYTGPGIQGDFGVNSALAFVFKPGTKYKALATTFDSTTQAPDPAAALSGYTTTGGGGDMTTTPATVYALQLTNGKFAIIQVDYSMAMGSATVRYKYQPSGSRFF